ncbi:hypothetical protein ABEH28_13310 [Pseudomonas sp. Ps21-P2]|uniref:hypothetical protein n=1 Tax=Pseudomonas sp. Ps21-P2 TaxID=3080331 RepID=UPI00320ACE65
MNKKSEEYEAFVYLNSVIINKEKKEPSENSRSKIDEALSIARKHNVNYLNEDGEFLTGPDGMPLTKEPTLVCSMRWAFGFVKLTAEEKTIFRDEFLGPCFNHKANL